MTKFYEMELHAASDQQGAVFRVFTHTGSVADLDEKGSGGEKKFRQAVSFEEAEDLYVALYAFYACTCVYRVD